MTLLKNKKMTLSISILMLLVFAVVLLTPNSISRFIKGRSGLGTVEVAKFEFRVNNSSNLSQSVNLLNTLTENDYCDDCIVPGTTGDIPVVLDFTNMEVTTDYTITIGSGNLPTNLKFYTDSGFANELSSINGTFSINGTTQFTHHIYWKWVFATDSASDANDSLYMNTNLSIPVVVTASQKIGGGL